MSLTNGTATVRGMTETSPTSSPVAAALSSGLVTAIDHVGIAVPDLDAALTWYAENVGLVSTHEEINEEQASGRPCSPFPAAPTVPPRSSCSLR